MTIIWVTPDDIVAKLDRIGPGTEIVLRPGRYRRVLRLIGKQGSADAPIVLRGEPGAVITDETSAEDFRRKGNELAKEVEDSGRFPGLYPWMLDGRLKLECCRHVRIEDLTFEKSWPTHVALQDCQNIDLARCRFIDGTFAIGAEGATTYGIVIEHCDWTQDRVADRLWQKIPWARVHGAAEDGGLPVDVAKDWRLFDGDFFRGDGIRGGIAIKHCSVSNAFNAIHLFGDKANPELALDVNVHGCRFFEIRDNIFEAESVAQNWWFWDNEIYNCHKWFSFECRRSRFIYLFGNRGWFDSVQGPPGLDDHRGGGVFKFDKKAEQVYGPHYIFHNSISTRSDYARKGSLPGMQHFNNAIRVIQPDDDLFDETPHFFGNLSVPRDLRESTGERFVTMWREHDIAWSSDVVGYAAWPQLLRDHGYPIGNAALGADPGFQAPFAGDLRLAPDSPCRGKSIGAILQMPDGEAWTLPAGQDIGAWQDDGVIKGPEFRPIADPRSGIDLVA
jgi:hypothetical protein